MASYQGPDRKPTTWERERFKNEIVRGDDLLGFTVVIEAPAKTVLFGDYRRKVYPNSVMGTIANWSDYHNVDFEWCGDRAGAERETVECLERWYKPYQSLYA